jgi:cytochrome c556
MPRFICLAVLAAVVLAPAADAQSGAERAVAARKAKFKDMGAAFKAVNDQVRRPTPDLGVVRASAAKIAGHANDLARNDWFPRGTATGGALKTSARPEIWSQAADFQKARLTLRAASGQLVAASRGTDPGAIRAVVKTTGEACSGCHQRFRVKDD